MDLETRDYKRCGRPIGPRRCSARTCILLVAGSRSALGRVGWLVASAPVEMPPTRYAKTSDGVHIAYQVYGDGPVDILLSGSLWWHLEFQWTDLSAVRLKERLARLGRV